MRRTAAVRGDLSPYWNAIEQAAPAQLASGAIYDALLGQCAVKSKAKTLYTWNTHDFLRLPIPVRVARPDEPH